jgi:hypothetical protein
VKAWTCPRCREAILPRVDRSQPQKDGSRPVVRFDTIAAIRSHLALCAR